MSGHKKKVVAFLVAIGLVVAALSLRADNANDSVKDQNTKPLYQTSDSGLVDDVNFLQEYDTNFSNTNFFLRMTFAILIVIALGAAAIYISKKLLPKIGSLAGKKIQVIETVSLGTRKSLHLIRVGSRQILIGSTNENITKLADVTEALSQSSGKSKYDDFISDNLDDT